MTLSPNKRSHHHDDDGPQEAVKPSVKPSAKKESSGAVVNDENQNGIKESTKESAAVTMSGRPSKRSRHSDQPQETAVKSNNNKSAAGQPGSDEDLPGKSDLTDEEKQKINRSVHKGIQDMHELLAVGDKQYNEIVDDAKKKKAEQETLKSSAKGDLEAANMIINEFKGGGGENTDIYKLVEDAKAEAKKELLEAAVPSNFNAQTVVDLLKVHGDFMATTGRVSQTSLEGAGNIHNATMLYLEDTKDLPLDGLKASAGAMLEAQKKYTDIERGIEELNAALGKKEAAEFAMENAEKEIECCNRTIQEVSGQMSTWKLQCHDDVSDDENLEDGDDESDGANNTIINNFKDDENACSLHQQPSQQNQQRVAAFVAAQNAIRDQANQEPEDEIRALEERGQDAADKYFEAEAMLLSRIDGWQNHLTWFRQNLALVRGNLGQFPPGTTVDTLETAFTQAKAHKNQRIASALQGFRPFFNNAPDRATMQGRFTDFEDAYNSLVDPQLQVQHQGGNPVDALELTQATVDFQGAAQAGGQDVPVVGFFRELLAIHYLDEDVRGAELQLLRFNANNQALVANNNSIRQYEAAVTAVTNALEAARGRMEEFVVRCLEQADDNRQLLG